VKIYLFYISRLQKSKTNNKSQSCHPPLRFFAVLFTTTGLYVGMRIIPINKLSETRFWPVINGIRHSKRRDRLN